MALGQDYLQFWSEFAQWVTVMPVSYTGFFHFKINFSFLFKRNKGITYYFFIFLWCHSSLCNLLLTLKYVPENLSIRYEKLSSLSLFVFHFLTLQLSILGPKSFWSCKISIKILEKILGDFLKFSSWNAWRTLYLQRFYIFSWSYWFGNLHC